MSTPPGRLPSTPELPIVHGSGNVFLDLGFEPEEAANLQLRSRLAIELDRYIEAEGITQTEAAERFGVSQPRVSDLVRGKLDRFTIDALVTMLARVGRQVEVHVMQTPVSRSAA
ncbi:helix-turn-helix transcriptional regulator [Rubrivirga sp. S365]|jgi:predicted XRE-type DNA-binding protein|uniref:helix-turn-helix domain-containing protein n=1 Tax=Rubrivirga sp. S365 TaxID=3076080 RepID=UPI0028C6B047|nr:helix-turn-helix transcriptional regulator [Rubrivirga sp. S365]MDT7858285.1 helix-turn-helix transcriptional regulator [Rubrivirga sp. S365]